MIAKRKKRIEYLNSLNRVLNLEQSSFRRESIHTSIIFSPEKIHIKGETEKSNNRNNTTRGKKKKNALDYLVRNILRFNGRNSSRFCGKTEKLEHFKSRSKINSAPKSNFQRWKLKKMEIYLPTKEEEEEEEEEEETSVFCVEV